MSSVVDSTILNLASLSEIRPGQNHLCHSMIDKTALFRSIMADAFEALDEVILAAMAAGVPISSIVPTRPELIQDDLTMSFRVYAGIGFMPL